MNRDELFIIERALSGQEITSEEAEQASEAVGALRCRDWSVRVLDAAEPLGWHFEWHGKKLTALTPGAQYRFFDATSRQATRHAAAKAVFEALPVTIRAELGEAP